MKEMQDKTSHYLRLYIQKNIPITREQAEEINEYICELRNIIYEIDKTIYKNKENLNKDFKNEISNILEGESK